MFDYMGYGHSTKENRGTEIKRMFLVVFWMYVNTYNLAYAWCIWMFNMHTILGAFAKLQKTGYWIRHVCPSALTGRIDTWVVFENLSELLNFH